MTRAHTIKMLLQHGPLRLAEIVVITGWGYHVVRHSVRQCRKAGLVVARNIAGYPYHHVLRCADVHRAPRWHPYRGRSFSDAEGIGCELSDAEIRIAERVGCEPMSWEV